MLVLLNYANFKYNPWYQNSRNADFLNINIPKDMKLKSTAQRLTEVRNSLP